MLAIELGDAAISAAAIYRLAQSNRKCCPTLMRDGKEMGYRVAVNALATHRTYIEYINYLRYVLCLECANIHDCDICIGARIAVNECYDIVLKNLFRYK